MAQDRAAASTPERPLRVGHYGGTAADRLGADARCAPRRVGRDAAGAGLDCLLVEWDATTAPVAAVVAGVESDIPVVVFDPEGSPARAAEATRAGAAEYVTPAALDDETVADRVVARSLEPAGSAGAPPAGERDDRAGFDPRPDVVGVGEGEAADGEERRRFARMFDGLPDAVVEAEFVDGEPVVRSVNDAFEDVFGYDAREAIDRPVNDLLVPAEYSDEARRIDRRAETAGHSIEEVERETARGRRTFLFRWLRYPTADGTRRGFGIYTDVTRRKRRQRRLRVLHRVLRHNLRNEVTGMKGYLDLLAEELDGADGGEYVDRLESRVDSVAALEEQAHHIEEALDEDNRLQAAVNPAAVASVVRARYREEHPEATFDLDVPTDPPPVLADSLLERAVEAVVENAVEHHDGTPTVEIAVEPTGDRWVDVVVRDDGPGIPERERLILSGEREITQLNHSMGLGLWVARWIVEGVDGQLRFGDCGDGSTVRLRLLRAEASP